MKTLILISALLLMLMGCAPLGVSTYIHTGGTKDGKPHGQGTRTFANGMVETGYWIDGIRHGDFVWIEADGCGRSYSTYANGKWLRTTRPRVYCKYGKEIIGQSSSEENDVKVADKDGIFQGQGTRTNAEETRKREVETNTISELKKDCEDIGFKPGTENFGDCVMRLMDR
jgi:hypothetical protein